MDFENLPTAEHVPSEALNELGFTPTGITDLDEEPKTFDIVIGRHTTVAVAYDEQHREWTLAGVDADDIERTLIAKGFKHGASPYAPGP